MSAAGVFKLIANDGKADKMIMATDLLNQRIKDIMCMRSKEGYQDPTPTLVDIERTHILFVNAHFKPFAAIGYEYNKVRTNSGNASFGESVQFSIPQFGDFFHDMVVNVQLSAVSAAANGTIPALPTQVNGIALTSGAGNYASTALASVAGSATNYAYAYVKADGTAASGTQQNFVRYCEYPGERLFSKVAFDVNGNPLDDYNSDVTIMYRKFRVAPGKLDGWKRLMGQEVPKDCYSQLSVIAGASNVGVGNAVADTLALREVGLPAGVPNVAPLISQSNNDGARQLTKVLDGPQTPKKEQPALSLWIPLLFWFNRDARLAIPSVSIPYGQRFITITFEQQANVLYAAPGNLYLQLTTVAVTFSAAQSIVAPTALTADNLTSYSKCVSRAPVLATGATSFVTANGASPITKAELYINNIFVNPEVHDIYIKRIGFSLIRVHRYQRYETSTANNEQLLSNLKWPIETIYMGVRPKYNVDVDNPNAWRDWHNMSRLVDKTSQNVVTSDALLQATLWVAGSTATTLAGAAPSSKSLAVASSTYTEVHPTVRNLTVTAHGIVLFNDFPSEFFASYMPWQYGGYNIVVPEDGGALMVNFCLYPGTYQPSGHINISRAREFYVKFSSDYVGVNVTQATGTAPNNWSPLASETGNQIAQVLVVGIAINFLLISDGSAVLRYST